MNHIHRVGGTQIARVARHPSSPGVTAEFIASAAVAFGDDGQSAVTWKITSRHGDDVVSLLIGTAWSFRDAIDDAAVAYRAAHDAERRVELAAPFLDVIGVDEDASAA